MPDRTETQRGPERTGERPANRTERDVTNIADRIPYYRENIAADNQALDIDGYDANTWNTGRVLRFENNLFIASRDGTRIAGFMLGSDAQGETVSVLDMNKSPVILSVLKEKFGISPTPPIARAENARRAEEERRPEVQIDEGVESVLSVLRQISVEANGEKLAVTWPDARTLSHYLRTNGVPPARYAQYAHNIRDHAALLSSALQSSKFGGTVTFDGQHFLASDGKKTFMTTATRVLIKGQGGTHTTLRGESVAVKEKAENATCTEYRIGDTTEIHRKDGGLAVVKQGSSLRYYDGRNDRALIEKQGNDVRVNGPYSSVGARPTGDAAAYGREIAHNLRTPEAIGAFISQRFEGQDYNGATREYAGWVQNIAKPGGKVVQYKADIANHTQDWKTTLERGAGDCEDFALLAEGLLREAGITAFAMMVNPVHYEAVYFERAANGKYYVCTVGLQGFNRSTTTFTSLGEAVSKLWQGHGSGAQVALQNPRIRSQFANPRDPNRYPENAPGIFQLRQPNDPVGTSDMVTYADEEFYKNYVRE